MTTPVSVSLDIAASPEKVWALVIDLPRMGEWSPENQGGVWAKGATGPAVGARFKGRNKNGKKSWSTSVEVNVLDAPKKFSFGLMALGKNWCDWIYEIEATATGCRVTHSWVDHRASWHDKLGKLVSGVSNRAVHNRKNMEITLQNLAAAATAQ
ncbi:unannotated protein [freshwater metagenome]|uniref:Unannotated protein n=1 Tax=freshwater metagenome TaxID=449393 RepID=A0A6J6I2W3_9ZZZZ|nr:SRPBCC family protein [Actinomycetota bacterium]